MSNETYEREVKVRDLEATVGINGVAVTSVFGNSTSGNFGVSISSEHSKAITGDFGLVVSADGSTSITGTRGFAISGIFGTSIVGIAGKAITRSDGTAQAGVRGILSIEYVDESGRVRVKVGYIGEDGLLPDTPYVLRDGKFTVVTE